uniref:Uncharacterized protein n=1 Tax=Heterorhabditis bacteriophora TaxID=37862 RepID=A0A1I7WFL2_HETBA
MDVSKFFDNMAIIFILNQSSLFPNVPNSKMGYFNILGLFHTVCFKCRLFSPNLIPFHANLKISLLFIHYKYI